MRKHIVLVLLLTITFTLSFNALAEEKTKEGLDATLIGGRLRYAAPPDGDWQRAENVNGDDAAAYARRDHQGAIAIQVLPPDAEMSPAMGGAVIRSLRDSHKKANQKILFGPKVEPDRRFALMVHEKYQSGDKVSDELHIYRNVGPRVVMVTVNAWMTDEGRARQVHKIGEDLLAGAKWAGASKK